MSIRLRLALGYAAVFALLALLFFPAIYITVERELLEGADNSLMAPSHQLLSSLQGYPRSLANVDGGWGAAGESRPSTDRRIGLDLEQFGSPALLVEVLDPNGRLVALSSQSNVAAVPVPAGAFAPAWWGRSASFTATTEGTRYRFLLTPIPGEKEPRGFVLAARSLEPEDASLSRVRDMLLVGALLGILLAGGIGWLIARRSLRPVEEISETARAIALSRGFSRRLRDRGTKDEVGRLAATFNEMLASLDEAYSAQRRFVADASHELRSPLTSIRSNIEILQRSLDAPREDRAEALADVASEVDRLSKMTSELLLLARADAGRAMEMSRVSLDDLVRDVHKQLQPTAKGLTFELGTLQRAEVQGNVSWLKQLLLILTDNAIKYTPNGGSVRVELEREGNAAILKVHDSGIGIPPNDLPHIFDRFYRADRARARNEGGAGLGLSIAQWITREHRGEIEVQSEVGRGTTVAVRVPAV